jgi:hypothetical protein
MKTYKKVEIVAKNDAAGLYAAGCPPFESGHWPKGYCGRPNEYRGN